jgi:hypothetical protein
VSGLNRAFVIWKTRFTPVFASRLKDRIALVIHKPCNVNVHFIPVSETVRLQQNKWVSQLHLILKCVLLGTFVACLVQIVSQQTGGTYNTFMFLSLPITDISHEEVYVCLFVSGLLHRKYLSGRKSFRTKIMEKNEKLYFLTNPVFTLFFCGIYDN